jgi:lysophospholipase L1-like esterase
MRRGAWVPTDELVAESIHLAEEYKSLAEKLNIPFVDTRHWNIDLTFDGVHFTEVGHHAFAENLRKELRL